MPTRDTAWPQGTPCWVDSQVGDTAAARTFYSELLGWNIEDTPSDLGYLTASVNDHVAAGIGPKPPGMDAMPSVWTTYLAVDSADEIAAKVTAAGGQLLMPPSDILDIGRIFVAADPTGAVFGAWEAKLHNGAAIYNENGAYCWNEIHTRDLDAAKKFYSDVFGYQYTDLGDGEDFSYSTFNIGGDPIGGMMDLTKIPGDAPAHWLTWFQVADTDAALEKGAALGGSVVMPANDSPFGRMGVLAGAQGEIFGVIDTSTTVGEIPEGT